MNKSKVYDVKDVKLSLLKTSPPKLSIVAQGSVPSGGWSDPHLIPYIYIQAPPDGIYDFDFIATPPDGLATQAFADIEVSHTLESIDNGLKGIRVHASQNSIVSLLNNDSSSGKTICIKGKLTDEGVECQALRTEDNELYTLVGDLKEFSVGDEVCISGSIAEISFCMQGTTVAVNWISKQ
ncbi:MAG TPA: hypothetical protein ENJ08_14880 [Gammaproteobacteria bacterium]|nr:hypothetical protein [Gammaproteobacteria bacterium]